MDRVLCEMSGQEPLWRTEALRTDPRWAKVRVLAKEFLFSQRG
jgi:hypothetical protein